MTNTKQPVTAVGAQNNRPADSESGYESGKLSMRKSMHDGVEAWCDCCSCEAEPYWIEAMQDTSGRPSADEDAG